MEAHGEHKLRPLCIREKNTRFTLSRRMVKLQRQGVDALKKTFPLQGINHEISVEGMKECNIENRN
jgi:hypothetical protein